MSFMSDDIDSMVEERLSIFDDEPDLNDWVEVMCGAAMAVLGIFHLIEPGELVDENIMRWFAAAVVAAGAVVRSDVAPMTVVGGVPAKLIKSL